MSEHNDEKTYLNFDEYIRQGDPQKKERAEAWRVAIGLQVGSWSMQVQLYYSCLMVRRCIAPPDSSTLTSWSEKSIN